MARRSKEAKQSIRRRRRMRLVLRMNALAAVGLAAVLLVMINYISHREYRRVDVSRSQFYQLSGKTHNLLVGLTNRVEMTMLFSPENSIYNDVKHLLDEYAYASDYIKVSQIDPHRDLAETRELAVTYGVEELDVVILAYQDKSHVIHNEDLVKTEYEVLASPSFPSQIDFLGEVVISSAIKNLVQGHQPHVYFLQGHGERDLASFDEYHGYSDFARMVRRDNILLRPLVLGGRSTMPDDAEALVISAPMKKMSQPELDILHDYMERSGRILLMLEPLNDGGLKPLLTDWGIEIRDDIVVDATQTLKGRELVISEYGNHPITAPLKGVSAVFYLPRSVSALPVADSVADPSDRPKAVVLASSSELGWAESDVKQQPLKFNPGEDRPGPVSIAIAVERGVDAVLDTEIPPTRLIAFGDSDFVANGAFTGGNPDLILSALNWLLEREEMMAIEGKPFAQYRLVVERDQMNRLLLVVIAGLPGAMGLLGFLVWLVRRV